MHGSPSAGKAKRRAARDCEGPRAFLRPFVEAGQWPDGRPVTRYRGNVVDTNARSVWNERRKYSRASAAPKDRWRCTPGWRGTRRCAPTQSVDRARYPDGEWARWVAPRGGPARAGPYVCHVCAL